MTVTPESQQTLAEVFTIPTTNGKKDDPSKLSAWEQSKAQALDGTEGDPEQIHDALYGLLLDKASEIIQSPRPIRQQHSLIKAIAADLGFRYSNADVSSLFDQLDASIACYEPDVAPGGEFLALGQSWLLHELILVGLNLFVGMPGAGKSRFLVAMIRAFLHDSPSFLGRDLQPGTNQHILLIGTDQDRQQWGALLAEQGLATIVDRTLIDNHEQILYKLHPRIYLKTSGGGFKLDADGMRYIRKWNQQHHGGITIIDSLSAVLPPGIKEADENAGRLMRQIELARQGNTCIVTHHSNKQSAIGGDLGVYSGSGHGSIDRAISRFIGLGYETHKENGIEKLHEDSPRRVLTSQKRGAGNQRIVLENGHHNTWEFIGTAAEVRELRLEDEQGSPEDRLKGWKRDVYEATSTDWLTTTEVFERLETNRAGSKNAKQQVRENLRKLATDHSLLEQEIPDGDASAEVRWRRKPDLFT